MPKKVSLVRVTGVRVRQGGPNVVLDLDVTYNGNAYLGVSVMKVNQYDNKNFDNNHNDDSTDRDGHL